MGKYQDWCKLLILTRIAKNFESDVFMPKYDEKETFTNLFVSKTYSEKDINYDFSIMGNKKLMKVHPQLIPTRMLTKYPKHEEMQYMEIIKDIMETGSYKGDRTGTGVISKFGY